MRLTIDRGKYDLNHVLGSVEQVQVITQLNRIFKIQFAEDIFAVCGYGEFADEKGIGDFSGGTTLSHKFGARLLSGCWKPLFLLLSAS